MTISGERWYAFTAFNSQAHYGFGTEGEAGRYCDILNRKREFNQYHHREMAADETVHLDSGEDTDGFRLDLALDTQTEQDDWQAGRDA